MMGMYPSWLNIALLVSIGVMPVILTVIYCVMRTIEICRR